MLIGQCGHAFQMTLEEYLLKGRVPQAPLLVSGWEGIWGMLITVLLFATAKLYSCPLVES